MSTNEQTSALHHYPRRFRWRAWPTGATLLINGRAVGGIIHHEWRGEWAGWIYGSRDHKVGPRRCDAKRAVECAAVRARGEENSK